MPSLRELLFRHWPIKLTALVLSAVLWAVVVAEVPTTEIIPITLEVSLPEGRALTEPLPTVQALYAGSARELFKLHGEAPVLFVSLPDTVTGTSFTQELMVADLITPGGADVNAIEVQPRLLRFTLDDAFESVVRVVPRVTATADSGYAVLAPPHIVPDSITIRGPFALVSQIRSVTTSVISLHRLRTSVRRTISIDTSNLGVVRPFPEEIEVIVDIGQLTERLILGVPVQVVAERPGEWETDPSVVTVTVLGLADRVARLTQDSVTAVTVISGATDEEPGYVRVTPPPGISAIVSPDTVIVRRRNIG